MDNIIIILIILFLFLLIYKYSNKKIAVKPVFNKYYTKDIIPKDNMIPNPNGTENLYIADNNLNKPYNAWCTTDLSSLPSYYRSDFTSQKLDLKQFYDENYKFRTKPLTKKMKSNKILILSNCKR